MKIHTVLSNKQHPEYGVASIPFPMEFCEGDCAKVFFETAWSAPHPVLEKLSETYPDMEIEHEWSDEDIGVNCGRFSYANGERTEEYFPESGREAIDFACSLWGIDVDEIFAERNNEEMMNQLS